MCDKAPLFFSLCFEVFTINLSSLLKPSFLHFNCEAVASPLVILGGVRASLYFPETPMREMSRCRDACGSGVFTDPCIDILFLGRVGINMAIKETELFLALGNFSSGTSVYWLMWWGEGGVRHPSVPLPSLTQLQGSDWIAAYSMSGLWCSPAECWFWWRHCDMVHLQELKLHSLIPSSYTNFFLALASLLLFPFLSWEVRLPLVPTVLKIVACTCEVFCIPCNKRSNKNIWINMNSCKCMYISTRFQK